MLTPSLIERSLYLFPPSLFAIGQEPLPVLSPAASTSSLSDNEAIFNSNSLDELHLPSTRDERVQRLEGCEGRRVP